MPALNPANPPAYAENIAMQGQRIPPATVHYNYGSVNFNTGHTVTQYIGSIVPDNKEFPEELERVREEFQRARKQSFGGDAEGPGVVFNGFNPAIVGGENRRGLEGADSREILSRNANMVNATVDADRNKTTQYQDVVKYDYMDIDQEGLIDLTDDTCDCIVELGGQVWNVARVKKLLETSGSTFKMILDIFGDDKFVQKFVTSKKAAFKHDSRSASRRTVPNWEVKPIRRFHLKVFAIEDQLGKNSSKFRQWSARRRGGRRCIAELDKHDHSISFSFIAGRYEKPIFSCWFPSMEARNIHRIYYDDRSSSLKLEWKAGRTLYAQLRPSHYKSFCSVLGLQASKLQHKVADKDLSSWARSVMKKRYVKSRLGHVCCIDSGV